MAAQQQALCAKTSAPPAPPAKVTAITDGAIAARRLQIIRDHLEAENVLDFDAAIDEFDHPRYELIGTRQAFDDDEEVREYYRRRSARRRAEDFP